MNCKRKRTVPNLSCLEGFLAYILGSLGRFWAHAVEDAQQ